MNVENGNIERRGGILTCSFCKFIKEYLFLLYVEELLFYFSINLRQIKIGFVVEIDKML